MSGLTLGLRDAAARHVRQERWRLERWNLRSLGASHDERVALVCIGGIVACFLGMAAWFMTANSQTFDEGVHLAAGQRYLANGDFQFNREHPPLTKILAALPAFLWYELPVHSTAGDQWTVGREYLYDSSISPKRLLILGRLSNVACGAATMLVVACWSWQLWGTSGSILSALFLAFDPNFLAHSCVATSDMGATFFFVATLYLLWRYSRRLHWPWLVAIGLALGGALGTKFSTVILAPVIAVVLCVSPYLFIDRPDSRKGRLESLAGSIACFAFVLLVAELSLWICYFGGDPGIWLDGLDDQLRHQEAGHPAFLLGEYSRGGWRWYFPVACLAKTPLGTLAALLLAAICWRKILLQQPRATLVVGTSLLLFGTAACLSRVNIGIRHLLPAYSLAFVLIGVVAIRPYRKVWQRLLVTGALPATVVIASLSTAPHQLANFNAAASAAFGGGHEILSDSNLDWGQDLEALSAWLKERGNPIVYLSYFGSAPPAEFGIRYQYLPTFGNSRPQRPWRAPPDSEQVLLAISVSNLQGTYLSNHDTFAWLRERTPFACIGGSIWIYDITGDQSARRRLNEIVN